MRRIRSTPASGALALLVALGGAGGAAADVVHFEDGTSIEGRIVRDDGLRIVIQVANGRITFDRIMVVRIEKKPWAPPAPEPAKPEPAPAPVPAPAPEPPASVHPERSADERSDVGAKSKDPAPADQKTREKEKAEADAKRAAEEEAKKLAEARAKAEEQVRMLEPKLQSPAYEEQMAALAKIVALGKPAMPAIARLAAQTRFSEDVRMGLLLAIERSGDPDGLPGVAGVLNEPGAPDGVLDQALSAAAGLGEHGKPLKARLNALATGHGRADARASAVRALAAIGEVGAVAGLASAIRFEEEAVRAAIADVLVSNGVRDEAALLALRSAALDAEPAGARRDAVRALAALDPDGHVLPDRAAGDPSPIVRGAALQALGKRKDRTSFDLLLRALAEPAREEAVIEGAALGLAARGDPQGIEPLIDVIRDAGPRAAEAVHLALQTLTGEQLPPTARAWKTWWEEGGGRQRFEPLLRQ